MGLSLSRSRAIAKENRDLELCTKQPIYAMSTRSEGKNLHIEGNFSPAFVGIGTLKITSL